MEEPAVVLDEEVSEAAAEETEEIPAEAEPVEEVSEEEPELSFGTVLDEEAAEAAVLEEPAVETAAVPDDEAPETNTAEESYKPANAEEREERMAAADQIEERPKLRIIETMRPVKPFNEKEAEYRMEHKNDVHGHWIHKTIEDASYMRGYKILPECTCSECGYEARAERPVCPSCGAVMKND